MRPSGSTTVTQPRPVVGDVQVALDVERHAVGPEAARQFGERARPCQMGGVQFDAQNTQGARLGDQQRRAISSHHEAVGVNRPPGQHFGRIDRWAGHDRHARPARTPCPDR